jgi:excisionase family DNA binding protein
MENSMPDHPRQTLTIEEAAKALGIGRNQGYEAARRGDIPTIRIGKRLLVLTVPFSRLLNGEKSNSEAA